MIRTEPPFDGGEREQLTAFLDFLREAVVLKCAGLTDEQARRSLVPSELTTIAGLVGHLTYVEHYWFEAVLAGRPNRWAEKLADDRDADFREALTVPLADLVAAYRAQCATSREIAAELAPDTLVSFKDGSVNLRYVLIHMVEETGRHAGHLDLLRELTDGRTGE
ncbi:MULTISPECIES: DinB family protein [Amycolatopsis]|uniref:DinB family protein n=1 Tax=Amycolatopsis thermalba TaxID=944492 RepID=A0ABY4NVR2_9PSEU|nr:MULTISPECIES: DinB family protein [Amycolatopsis]OXM71864.1 mini-circle protein [Amycolatopsis sp. KNN50.9b]UQS24118.1 DinB family protein [Amycolatopsis thermalba]